MDVDVIYEDKTIIFVINELELTSVLMTSFEQGFFNNILHGDDRDLEFDMVNILDFDTSSLSTFVKISKTLDSYGRSLYLLNLNDRLLSLVQLYGYGFLLKTD